MDADKRAEIVLLRARDPSGGNVPSAHEELNAVIAHTAASTNTILESCEVLDRIASDAPAGLAAQLQAATTVIYEACGFQDITSQRIKKVVAALQSIDGKAAAVLATGQSGGVRGEALTGGPQLPGAAMAQDSIDRLLASLA